MDAFRDKCKISFTLYITGFAPSATQTFASIGHIPDTVSFPMKAVQSITLSYVNDAMPAHRVRLKVEYNGRQFTMHAPFGYSDDDWAGSNGMDLEGASDADNSDFTGDMPAVDIEAFQQRFQEDGWLLQGLTQWSAPELVDLDAPLVMILRDVSEPSLRYILERAESLGLTTPV